MFDPLLGGNKVLYKKKCLVTEMIELQLLLMC